jgi:hypothetical protein
MIDFKKDGTINGLSYSKSLYSKGRHIPSRILLTLSKDGQRSVKTYVLKVASLHENYNSAVRDLADFHNITQEGKLFEKMQKSISAFIKKYGLVEEHIIIKTKKIEFKSNGLSPQSINLEDSLESQMIINEYGFPFGIYFQDKLVSAKSSRPSVVSLSHQLNGKKIGKSYSTSEGLECAYAKAIDALCEIHGIPQEMKSTLLSTLPAFINHYKIEAVPSEEVSSFYRVTSEQERKIEKSLIDQPMALLQSNHPGENPSR